MGYPMERSSNIQPRTHAGDAAGFDAALVRAAQDAEIPIFAPVTIPRVRDLPCHGSAKATMRIPTDHKTEV